MFKKIFLYVIVGFLVVIGSGYYFLNQHALKVAETLLQELEPKIEDWFNRYTEYKSEKIYITYDLVSVSIFKKINLENIEIKNVSDKISLEKLSININDNSFNINEATNIDYFVLDEKITIDSFSVNDLPFDSLSSEGSFSDIAFNDLIVDDIKISEVVVDESYDALSLDFDEIQIKSYDNYSLKGLQIKGISLISHFFNSSIGNILLDNFDNFDSFIALLDNQYQLGGLDSIDTQNAMNYYGVNRFSIEDVTVEFNQSHVEYEIKVGLIDLTVGRNDKKFLVADSIKYELKKLRVPFSSFEPYIAFETYQKILEWDDEFVFNAYGSLNADTKNSSVEYEIQYGIEKLGSIYSKLEFGGYTEDLIEKSINDPYYFEKVEALNDVTLKSVNLVYTDEGLNTLGFKTLYEMGISRQDLQFSADQLITSSPFITSKYKIQLMNALQNLMAGGIKIDISFNSKYPDGIKLGEFEYLTLYNFDRYGEFLIKVE